MGLAVIPGAVVAGVLAPLGLSALPLWVMEQATRWILGVAAFVADLPGAVGTVASPGPWVLPLMALGGLWVAIWAGRVRHLGWVAVAAGLWLWPAQPRPLVLIAADGGLVGVLGPEGRALSSPRGNGFAAGIWLESDGDRADQTTAAARPGFDGDDGMRRFTVAGRPAIHLRGRDAAGRLGAACAQASLVVLAAEASEIPPGCAVVDRRVLAATGPLAIHFAGEGLRLAVLIHHTMVHSTSTPACGRPTGPTRKLQRDARGGLLRRPPGTEPVSAPCRHVCLLDACVDGSLK